MERRLVCYQIKINIRTQAATIMGGIQRQESHRFCLRELSVHGLWGYDTLDEVGFASFDKSFSFFGGDPSTSIGGEVVNERV